MRPSGPPGVAGARPPAGGARPRGSARASHPGPDGRRREGSTRSPPPTDRGPRPRPRPRPRAQRRRRAAREDAPETTRGVSGGRTAATGPPRGRSRLSREREAACGLEPCAGSGRSARRDASPREEPRQNLLITRLSVPGRMARVDVIAFSPTEVLEETDVTIGRGRELVEKFPVAWINIIAPDPRTLEELETLFGLHPLALEDSTRPDTAPKVETYEDVLFAVTRTIVWAEEIETDQLSIFLGKTDIITIHDKIFPQLEDVRVKIQRKAPRILKNGPDYLCYTILDVLVDSYFPQLDRLGDIIHDAEEQLIESPTKVSISRIHDIRVALLRLPNTLPPPPH